MTRRDDNNFDSVVKGQLQSTISSVSCAYSTEAICATLHIHVEATLAGASTRSPLSSISTLGLRIMGRKLYQRRLTSIALLTLAVQPHVLAQQLLAPAWPLAVKNPYLNSWYLAGPAATPLNNVWPNLWNGMPTSWFCNVLVDSVPYTLMGDYLLPTTANSTQWSVQITPTQTIIQVTTGPVNVTMNFLSPITVRSALFIRITRRLLTHST